PGQLLEQFHVRDPPDVELVVGDQQPKGEPAEPAALLVDLLECLGQVELARPLQVVAQLVLGDVHDPQLERLPGLRPADQAVQPGGCAPRHVASSFWKFGWCRISFTWAESFRSMVLIQSLMLVSTSVLTTCPGWRADLMNSCRACDPRVRASPASFIRARAF